MSKLTLDQFKTDNKNTNGSRLTLDQFKSQNSNNNNEELEKLAGGVLGACHVYTSDMNAAQVIGYSILDALHLGGLHPTVTNNNPPIKK